MAVFENRTDIKPQTTTEGWSEHVAWTQMSGGKNELSLGDLREYNKIATICFIGKPEEKEEGGAEKIFKEIMADIFPSVTKDINLQI